MRIQFNLSESQVKTLEKMMSDGGFRTKIDLINSALTLLEWSFDQVKTGRIIASVDEENKNCRELVMSCMLHARNKERAKIKELVSKE